MESRLLSLEAGEWFSKPHLGHGRGLREHQPIRLADCGRVGEFSTRLLLIRAWPALVQRRPASQRIVNTRRPWQFHCGC